MPEVIHSSNCPPPTDYRAGVSTLVLVNGAPGSGKSTVAARLAAGRPMMLALDIDTLKHALGGWADDPHAAGLHARRLALAVVREQLTSGHDVVIGQYVARTQFIDELADAAQAGRARFVHAVLDIDSPTLAWRLAARAADPDRPEHQVNNQLVRPRDADHLLATMRALQRQRPPDLVIDASGSVEETVDELRSALRGRLPFAG